MRFYQQWNRSWTQAAQRAQQCTTAYRSRQQPTAEEATATMSPLFYQVVNGRHGACSYNRRAITITYIRTDDVVVGDYTADSKDVHIHVLCCASIAKARNVANEYQNTYDNWELIGTLADYNTGNRFNRIFKKQVPSTNTEFAVSTHYALVTDTYNAPNLAVLLRQVYLNLNYPQAIADAILTLDPDVVDRALETQREALEQVERELELERERTRAAEEEAERARRREMRTNNAFENLETLFPTNAPQYPENAIATRRVQIQDHLRAIREIEGEIRQYELEYLLSMQNNTASEFTALLDAIKEDPEIVYSDEHGLHVHTFMQTWDMDNAQTLYDASARVNNVFTGEDWYKQLMKELFITCDTKILFKGFYKIQNTGQLTFNHTLGLHANPHHQHYNCFGEYASLMQRAFSERAYLQWYGLFKACISTVNVLDGPVMTKLKQDLCSPACADINWLFTDNEFMSIREWRRRYETYTLHVRPDAAEEPDRAVENTTDERAEDGEPRETNEGDVDPAPRPHFAI